MNTKEITALRKSGHIDEALDAAEKEFALNANLYTAGALFWCLNEIFKQQTGEEAASTIERMKTLYNDYCSGDEYMSPALDRALRRTLPHYQDIKNAVVNAQNGADTIADYQRINAWYKEGNLDASLYQDFGWLIYYALRQTPAKESYKKKHLLSQYFELNLPRPSILHSLILMEFKFRKYMI